MPGAALVVLLALLATAAVGPTARAEEDETVVGPEATQLSIERRVEGEAPAGARFVVALACEGLDRVELDVAAGEVRSLPVPQGQACELTEVDDGGAASVTIAVGEVTRTQERTLAFSTGDEAELTVTVTSRFASAAAEDGSDAGAGGATGPGSSPRQGEEDTEVLDGTITPPSRVDAGGGALGSAPSAAALAAVLLVVASLAALAVAARRGRGRA